MSARGIGSGILTGLLAVAAASAGDERVAPEVPGRDLPDSLTEQARSALARDAWRRELRFFGAVDPDAAFRSTRVDQTAIDEGRQSIAELYPLGGRLFRTTFTARVGFGDGETQGLSRVHRGRRGGPDASSCNDCHRVGGPAGAGDAVDNAFLDGDGSRPGSALARNPPALTGLGVIESLASEMSAELAAARSRLADRATREQADVRGALMAKGVSFGFLTVRADGFVDTREVRGIDPDLVVRPFGWKGTFATIRDTVEDELLLHHGMQSSWLAHEGPTNRVGAHRRPDPDGDGITDEITEGQVTALTIYLALQEIPRIAPPQETLVPVTAWATGRRRFEELGCGDCHRASLPLADTTFELPSRRGGPTLRIDLATDGAAPRIAPPVAGGAVRAYLFSDLRRHDMGPGLAEARPDRGVEPQRFLTPPLWGLARSGPYLHDGRAPTLEDAILWHGGDAAASRERFAALTEEECAPLRIFLASLTRARRMVAP